MLIVKKGEEASMSSLYIPTEKELIRNTIKTKEQ
jgi:hypothetical protein